MGKKVKIYIALFAVVVALMMYLEYSKPKPVDWRQTYSARDKIPFGTYVLAHELPKILHEKKIHFIDDKTVATSLADYNYIDSNHEDEEGDEDEDYPETEQAPEAIESRQNISTFTDGAYLIFGNYSDLSAPDQNELLRFVQNGNDAFLLAAQLPEIISDSLKIKILSHMFFSDSEYKKVKFHLANPNFPDTVFKFPKRYDLTFFSRIDTANVTVLGYFSINNARKINFIKQQYGKGYFYINLFPRAFGNYYLLNDSTNRYSISCLNYIEKPEIFWNDYKKSINQTEAGLLIHIVSNPPLHWAWTILIATAIFYMLFFGKRRQRIIPVVTPLQNTTVEFTKTIGNLYYNNRQHGDLLQKKIKYFLYFVKEKFFIQTETTDSEFSELLHLKSGVSQQITDHIVFLVNKNKNPEYTTEADLKEVNRAIDMFYKALVISG
ncbi:MAG: hypothetical protein LBS01_00375 [Prevotellaceae bacterium]|nr:hypothetical protein [Prevotellaceae bacterium]